MQPTLEEGDAKKSLPQLYSKEDLVSELDTATDAEIEGRLSSSQFLAVEAKGRCACLERLPLWFKLLLLALIAIFGMLVFALGLTGAQIDAVIRNNNAKAFSTLSARVKLIPLRLGYERAYAVLYQQTKIPEFISDMNRFRGMVNTLIEDMVPTVNSVIAENNDPLAAHALQKLLTLKSEIDTFRKQFDQGAVQNIFLIVETYSAFLSTISAALMRLCIQSQSQQNCLLHNTLMRTVDYFGSNIALGSVMIVRNATDPQITSQFISTSDRTVSYIRYALDIAGQNEWQLVNSTFNGDLGLRITNITSHLALWSLSPNRPSLTSFMGIDDYVNITTTGLGIIAAVANTIEDNIQQFTKADTTAAILLFVFVVVALVVAFIVIIAASLCFSRSITGPWQRMNELLENTISQFVPKDILKIIKIPRIIDLKYGLVVEKQLTVMRSSIANYSQLVAKMTPSERFNFYNTFLNAIGPIIRKHSGFIEKYLPDGFAAVFKSNKDGLRAAEELNSYSDIFNKTFQDLPNVKLYSAVSAGDCFVGTVGEAKRMDVSLLGEAATLATRLSSMHDKFKAKILTTKPTLSSKVKVKYRLLGNMRIANDKPEVEIFEIITANDYTKEQYVEQFTQAVTKMLANDFEAAFPILEAIVKSNPLDMTAEYQYQQCKSIVNDNELTTSVKLTLDDVLADAILYDAFQEFCIKELSYENVRVYNLISQFKAAAPNERRKLVLTLYEEFLAAESKYELNVNTKFKQDLKSKLSNSDFAFEANALDALQTEIELLMTDTHKRFKQSETLRKAIRKKLVVQA